MKRLLKILPILLLFVGCAGPSKKEPTIAAPDLKRELHQAELEATAGANKKALDRLRRIINRGAQTDAADDAFILIGQIHYKTAEFEESYKAFISVLNSEYFSPREVDAALGAARALYKLARYDEALSLTTRVLKDKNLSPALRSEVYGLRVLFLQQTGDRLDALRALVYLAGNSPEPEQREKAKLRATEAIESGLRNEQLEVVAKDPEFGFLRPTALMQVGLMYFEQRNYDRAADFFRDVVEIAPNTEPANSAESYLRQIEARRRVDPYVIGAVLPLSGKHSGVATRTLRGLELGLGIRAPQPTQFKIAVVDSDGNPDSARRGVERLVVEDSTIAIVGDLLSKTAEPVAQKADELGVPIIGLSQKAGLTDLGDNVFRNAITSASLVKELVSSAMEKYGLRRFAIIYPNDAYGTEYANLFWDEVLTRGGTIAAAQTYSTDDKDFNSVVSRLVGTFYVEDRADEYTTLVREWYQKQKAITSRTTPPTDLLAPVLDFDAIFIPDGAKMAGQIASMLVYQEVRDVRLLGTNLWNTDAIVERGTQLIQNSLFVEAANVFDSSFKKNSFHRLYVDTYGEDPNVFDAQAYDVGLALRNLIERGAKSRVLLREELARLKGLDGASGRFEVTESREFTRPLVVLTVKDGKIERAQPPPATSTN